VSDHCPRGRRSQCSPAQPGGRVRAMPTYTEGGIAGGITLIAAPDASRRVSSWPCWAAPIPAHGRLRPGRHLSRMIARFGCQVTRPSLHCRVVTGSNSGAAPDGEQTPLGTNQWDPKEDRDRASKRGSGVVRGRHPPRAHGALLRETPEEGSDARSVPAGSHTAGQRMGPLRPKVDVRDSRPLARPSR
jgi:hypothetical protein